MQHKHIKTLTMDIRARQQRDADAEALRRLERLGRNATRRRSLAGVFAALVLGAAAVWP